MAVQRRSPRSDVPPAGAGDRLVWAGAAPAGAGDRLVWAGAALGAPVQVSRRRFLRTLVRMRGRRSGISSGLAAEMIDLVVLGSAWRAL